MTGCLWMRKTFIQSLPWLAMEDFVHDRNQQRAKQLASLAYARVDPSSASWERQQVLLNQWWTDNAALLELPLVEAATNVVPVAITAAESVARLRTWASGRCLSASQPGIYSSSKRTATKTGRQVCRDPLQN